MAEDSEENGATEPVEAPEGEAAEVMILRKFRPRASVAVASVAEEVEDAPDDDCPPCKGGAPAWMATFADMATLLMAFFVLILSFAQMNVPKFKEVSGSMNDSMGVQRQVPVVEPLRRTILLLRSLFKQRFRRLLLKLSVSKPPTKNSLMIRAENNYLALRYANSSDVELVKSALREEIERGLVTVDESSGTIQVSLSPRAKDASYEGDSGAQSGRRLDADTVQIFAKVANAQAQVATLIEVTDSSPVDNANSFEGSSAELAELREIASNQVEELRLS